MYNIYCRSLSDFKSFLNCYFYLFAANANIRRGRVFNEKQTSLETCPNTLHHVWWGRRMTNASIDSHLKHSIFFHMQSQYDSYWGSLICGYYLALLRKFHKCVVYMKCCKKSVDCWDFVNSGGYCYNISSFLEEFV